MDYTLPELKTAYVIYDPVTGLYSKGGTYNVWRKKPKVWSNIGFLKNHLHLHVESNYRAYKGHEEIHDIVSKKLVSTVAVMLARLRQDRDENYKKWLARTAKDRIKRAEREMELSFSRLQKIIEERH